MTANNCTNNNVFFLVSDLKIVCYNNYQSSIKVPWTTEENYFASILLCVVQLGDINNNGTTNTYSNTVKYTVQKTLTNACRYKFSGDFVVQVQRLLTSGLSSTREERERERGGREGERILKSLSYHTMLTKLKTARSDPNFSTP